MTLGQIKERLQTREYDFLRTDEHLGRHFVAVWKGRLKSPLSDCGFSQLKALEFFVFRKMEMPETENHLLRGWCSKCL